MHFRSLMKLWSAAVLVMLLSPTIARSQSTACPRDNFGTIKPGLSHEAFCKNCYYLPCIEDCDNQTSHGSPNHFCESNCRRVEQACMGRPQPK
jgi:hypothetical protein